MIHYWIRTRNTVTEIFHCATCGTTRNDENMGAKCGGEWKTAVNPERPIPATAPAPAAGVARFMKSWAVVAELRARNARHKRKRWALQDQTPEGALKNAREEITELSNAERFKEPEINRKKELADVFGTLFHYAQMRGYTLEQIDDCLCEKLAERFE